MERRLYYKFTAESQTERILKVSIGKVKDKSTSETYVLTVANRLFLHYAADYTPNSITLSSSLAGRRPVREPARELDSVMEFGLMAVIRRAKGKPVLTSVVEPYIG